MSNLYVSSVGWNAVTPWDAPNQFLWSEDLTNAAWTKTDSTITSNSTIDSNGASTADLVTEGSAGTAVVQQTITVPAGATVSFTKEIKRGNHDWVRLTISDGTNESRAWFNVNTGATGGAILVGTAVNMGQQMTQLSNGFWRCTLVARIPSATSYTLISCSAASTGSVTRSANGTRTEALAMAAQAGGVVAYQSTTTAVGSAFARSVGDIRRQAYTTTAQNGATPVGSERVFRCTTAGTSASAEPMWNLSKGGTTTDNTAVWTEITGNESFQVAGAWAAPYARVGSPNTTYVNAINSVSAGGTGYTLNDILTGSNGTLYGSAMRAKVTGVSGGVVTALTLLDGGSYSLNAGPTSNSSTFTGGTGSGCTAAVGVLNAFAAGDIIYVASSHAETQSGSLSLTFPGTDASPNFMYCVDETGAGHVPPTSADLKLTATITAASMTVAGSLYWYGTGFLGTTATGALNFNIAASVAKYEKCSFNLGGTSGTLTFGGNAVASRVDLVDCTAVWAAALQTLRLSGLLNWKNGASVGQAFSGTLPTTLLNTSSSVGGRVLLEGIDLSNFGAGKVLAGTPAGMQGQVIALKDCKLGASVTVASTPNASGRSEVFVIRCDSGATNYRNEKYTYAGTETTETAIVRSGGASNGVTAQSRKIVTTANSRWVLPFEAIPITFYCDVAGVPYTAVLEGTINAAAVPKNDEIWLDVEYLGSASTPQGSFATGTKSNNLAAGTNLTASSASWDGGGSAAGWSPFQLSVTFTPQQAGWVTLYVKAALPSTTYYIDPRPTGLNIFKTYVAGSASPIIVNERDLADTTLDAIEVGVTI